MVLRLKILGEDKQNFVEFAVLLSPAVTGILTLKNKQKRNNKECMISMGWFFFFFLYNLHPLCDSVNIAKA